jgi:hypothetical protein
MTGTRFLQAYVAVVLIAYTAGAFLVPPGMYSDSGWGFAVWRSMKGGAPFNWPVGPDRGDIAQDAGGFLSWWTPGQYLIPGALADCGCSLGRALTLTVALFSALGVVGWYLVYRAFGFSGPVAWLSCAVIASARFFALPFGIYNGGEILLFCASPFILLLALRWSGLRWYQCGLMVTVFLAGFFLKSSALVLALAVCVAVPLSNWRSYPGGLRQRLGGCFKWAMVFLVTCAVAHLAYNSRGKTPVAAAHTAADRPVEKCFFPVAAPLLSSVFLDDFLSYVLSNPGRRVLPNWQVRPAVILPLVLLSCLAYYCVGQYYAGSRYGSVCLAFLLVYAVFFAALNVRGAAVSADTEARHYRYAGLVLLPGLLSVALLRAPRAARWASVAVVFALCVYGLSSYFNRDSPLRQTGQGSILPPFAAGVPTPEIPTPQSLDEQLFREYRGWFAFGGGEEVRREPAERLKEHRPCGSSQTCQEVASDNMENGMTSNVVAQGWTT